MMRELLGREGGCLRRQGRFPCTLRIFGVGMLGANGVVGAKYCYRPPVLPTALNCKARRPGWFVVFFGDGAINRGTFFGGVELGQGNLICLCFFVCEDNQYSASTKTDAMTAGDGAAARAIGLGAGCSKKLTAMIFWESSTPRVKQFPVFAMAAARKLIQTMTYRQTGTHLQRTLAAYRPEGGS